MRARFAILLTALAATLLPATPAGADPAPDAWATLRQCESSGNYQAVSRTGKYMGAYQFDQATWNSVGGTGRPDQASVFEQDYRALYLYRMRGWQPWSCAKSKGLVEDADARSKRVPTAAEASAVSGASADGTLTATPVVAAPLTAAPWPGKVKYYRYGQCAKAVRTFQLALNTRGYAATFQGTGCYLTKTRTAVVAVQRANGIPAHGRLNKRTWNAAFVGTAPQ